MTYLMKNPRATKKVQEEIRSLIGDRGFVDEDDVHQLFMPCTPYVAVLFVIKADVGLFNS